MNCECCGSNTKGYFHRGYWVEIYLEVEEDLEPQTYNFVYTALIELPNQGGVWTCEERPRRHNAIATANRTIDELILRAGDSGSVLSPLSR